MLGYRAARLGCLAVLLGATAGRNALRSSFALYLTVGIGAFVLFAGNGLDAKTVTSLATTHRSFGFALTLIWVLAALPVARALLASSETYFLRALPVSRSEILAMLGAGLVMAHAPWALLWGRGAGPGAALGATLIALAFEVHILAGLRTATDLGAVALTAAASGLFPSYPYPAAFFAGPAFLLGVRQAFLRAPEPRSFGRDAICTRGRALALASALGVSVYRGHGPVIARAVLLASGACVVVVLGLRNNDVVNAATIRRIALMVWGPACLFGAVGIAGPVLAAESKAGWLLDLCGVSASLRSASAAGLLAACGAVLGGIHGAIIGEALDLALAFRIVLVIENAAAGAAWAALALSLLRVTRFPPARDGKKPREGRAAGRLLLVISALCVASAALLMSAPRFAVVVLLVAAGGLAVAAGRLPASG